MAKKSVEDLDAELAALEAELAALETGGPAKGRSKAKRQPPPEEAEEPAAPEPALEAEAPARKPRFRGLAKRAKETPEAEAPPQPKASRLGKLPFGRAKRGEAPAEGPPPEAAGPEATPPPAPEPEGLAWEPRGQGWRAAPRGPQRIEVVRRELDASGRVLAEEQVGEELEEPAPPPPEEPRRFGFLRGKGEAPPEAPVEPGAAEPSRKRRRGRLVLIPVLLVVLLLLLVAVALPLAGVDPLGVGGKLGVGGGGQPPPADFALGAAAVAVGTPVMLCANCGADAPAGLEYSWDFGDGGGDQGQRVEHAWQQRGTFTITLTARDSGGRTATHSATLTVLAPPVARFVAQVNGRAAGPDNPAFNGTQVGFDASGSTAEGGVSRYAWNFGDGSAPGAGRTTAHSYAAVGGFNVTLTVTDSNDLRGSASATLFVGQRVAVAGTMPATVPNAAAVNQTVALAQSNLAKPTRLRAILAFDANVSSGVPALPGAVNPNNLGLTIYDPAGAAAAAASGEGSPKDASVDNPAPGAWSVQVSRPVGGASDEPYTLLIEVTYGPR
jgi:PKD repeat protein